MLESANLPTHRRAWRHTDDFTPGAPQVKLVVEPFPLPLSPTQVLIKVRAVALNYRDAHIANGGNPWPVLANGILGNDDAGEVVAAVSFVVGDRVAPVIATEFVTSRETGLSWLAADEDGVLADYLVFDEKLLAKLPLHLEWVNCSIIPCAGTMSCGQKEFVKVRKLMSGTGARIWHTNVLGLTDGVGVDLVLENGGTPSLVQSVKFTRIGGIVSQVGYLGEQNPAQLEGIFTSVPRLSATKLGFDDIMDSVFEFEQAEEAISYLWEGRQVGKLVLRL
ncbi:GroES-like protein [Colletotrichum zoysiae]|uniref:GroES-like protein n=1 Tax=Colletotrichum zoysiae TaxID=1216348 RepID=A0AAD9H6J0_9PEZI|nr:GroES-like protein [Colletotrichum zoysiae]